MLYALWIRDEKSREAKWVRYDDELRPGANSRRVYASMWPQLATKCISMRQFPEGHDPNGERLIA